MKMEVRLGQRMCVFSENDFQGEYAAPLKCARIPHHSAIGKVRISQYCNPPIREIAKIRKPQEKFAPVNLHPVPRRPVTYSML